MKVRAKDVVWERNPCDSESCEHFELPMYHSDRRTKEGMTLCYRIGFEMCLDADQWDLAGSGMHDFVNILINILTPILELLYKPNHQGRHMQRNDERDKTNHLVLYYTMWMPQSIG